MKRLRLILKPTKFRLEVFGVILVIGVISTVVGLNTLGNAFASGLVGGSSESILIENILTWIALFMNIPTIFSTMLIAGFDSTNDSLIYIGFFIGLIVSIFTWYLFACGIDLIRTIRKNYETRKRIGN